LAKRKESNGMITKQKILNEVTDLAARFLYYDRKEDTELTLEALTKAVHEGTVTVDELVEEFRNRLEETF
jgi:hypothetical protein